MPADEENTQSPRVFVSYSWDSPEHKLWVESFALEMRKVGIDARLDTWRNKDQSIDDFMMIELELADYVIAICTPEFKQKIIKNAEGIAGTASGFEIGTAAALRRGTPVRPRRSASEHGPVVPMTTLLGTQPSGRIPRASRPAIPAEWHWTHHTYPDA